MTTISFMGKKSIFTYFFICFFVFAFGCNVKTKTENQQKKDTPPVIEIATFPIQNGDFFGYEILIDGKIIIHQETIPAVDGNQYFQTRKFALKVGNAVKEKIEQNKNPGLSKEEILKLKGSL